MGGDRAGDRTRDGPGTPFHNMVLKLKQLHQL